MKIVFFGTSEFAASILQRLAGSGHSVAAVVTQPDRKGGRLLKTLTHPVKKRAKELALPLYQTGGFPDRELSARLKAAGADLFVVAAFGTILKKDLLDIPDVCSLNAHASLLPKYRGAAPVNWAVINGERKTGVSVIRMNERMDAGDIVIKRETDIGKDETSEGLSQRLAEMGGTLVLDAIELIRSGAARFLRQDEAEATFAPKLKKKDGKLDWSADTVSILNRVRGLKPWPGAYSFIGGRVLKIISAGPVATETFSHFSPGEVVAAGAGQGLFVKTGDGAISVFELQIEGKKPMRAEPFLRGHKIEVGKKLG